MTDETFTISSINSSGTKQFDNEATKSQIIKLSYRTENCFLIGK